MLLTMRGIRERRALTFANPERLDKIKEVRRLKSIYTRLQLFIIVL